jgi:hypothetical protein
MAKADRNKQRAPSYRRRALLKKSGVPLHLLLIDDMTQPKYSDRFRSSAAAGSTVFACGSFYKHISRPLPASAQGEVTEEVE